MGGERVERGEIKNTPLPTSFWLVGLTTVTAAYDVFLPKEDSTS